MSAKTKLVSFIGSLFVVIILFTTILSFFNFKSSSVEGYTDSLDTESFLISNAVEQKMSRYFDGLRLMARMLSVDDQGNIGSESLLREQLSFVEKELSMAGAAFGLASGVTYNTNGVIANFNAKALKREWFTRSIADEKNVVTNPYVNNVGKLVMSLSVPVKRSGKVIGVLNSNIEVDSMSTFVNELSNGKNIVVNRSDGFILAAQDVKNIGMNIYDIHPSYGDYKTKDHAGHSYTFEGIDYFVMNSQFSNLDWLVWSADSWSQINAKSNSNLVQSSLVGFVLVVLSLIIVYALVIKLMYVPIGGEPKEIEAIVQKVASGDLSITDKKTGEETGIYAATLHMVTNLKASIERINHATDQLNQFSTDMAESSTAVNLSSEKQMVQLENTATSMHEMTMTVDEVARNALQASTAANETNEHSTKGIAIVAAMNKNINVLTGGIEKVVLVTNALEAETQNIGSILEVINGISEQTNLLALNAAIEAARAGEQGRGFAVVADEVRNLANRTKESTNEIQEMISRLQIEAKRSVDLMKINVDDAKDTEAKSESASQALEAIQNAVSLIQDMNSQIATAAEEQTHVASEINTNIVNVNDLAKSTFEQSKVNSNRARELMKIATSLSKSVEVFKL